MLIRKVANPEICYQTSTVTKLCNCFQIHIQKGKTPPNIFAKIDTNQDKKISKEEMGEFILETGILFLYFCYDIMFTPQSNI